MSCSPDPGLQGGVAGDKVTGEFGDSGIVEHPGGRGDDGADRSLVLTGALCLREQGESTILLRGETKSHGHAFIDIRMVASGNLSKRSAGWSLIQGRT